MSLLLLTQSRRTARMGDTGGRFVRERGPESVSKKPKPRFVVHRQGPGLGPAEHRSDLGPEEVPGLHHPIQRRAVQQLCGRGKQRHDGLGVADEGAKQLVLFWSRFDQEAPYRAVASPGEQELVL